MYSAERRQEILKLIDANAHVRVADLADQFGVSRASIRRDLNHLHRFGRLQRTYGGALGGAPSADEAPFAERKVASLEQKERIGRAAAQLVRAGETIFIDGGTTTECMTPYLADKAELTVVTYGLNIVNRLAGLDNLTLIVIGGTLHPASQTFGGILALNNMQAYNMRFDKTFVAAGGVAADGGVTNASLELIPIKQRAIEAARETILLADASKIGVVRTALIAPLLKIRRLITDEKAVSEELQRLRLLGLLVDVV
jgi:DeoR/GlpR family transcriptional regulator of sugar metabolism